MLCLVLLSLTIGIEGGYAAPALEFKDINSGVVFSLFTQRRTTRGDIALVFQSAFYTGDNERYSLTSYGVRIGLSKNAWRFSPVIEIGGDYLSRAVGDASESGYAFTYGIGLLWNLRKDKLRFYPKVYYEGLTDLKEHGGFLGFKMGFTYEM
jgi:hypothetical protein